MFFAIELQSPEYTSRRNRRASSSRPSSPSAAPRLVCATRMLARCAKAPQHSQLGLLHGQRVLVVSSTDKPFPSCVIALFGPNPSTSGRPTFWSSSTPIRAHTARRRGIFHARTGYTCTTAPMPPRPCCPNYSPQPPRCKIFACSARHDTCAKPAVPRHEHPRTRPSFVFQWRACVQMKHVWPFVSSAHASDRDRDGLRVLLICIILLGAACFLYQFAEIIVATLFPVLHLACRPAVACAAAAALLAQGLVRPSSVAQTAHCVRIILCPGQPPRRRRVSRRAGGRFLVSYSASLPVCARRLGSCPHELASFQKTLPSRTESRTP